ncbi:zinc-dependent alcohol dehydrogenase family protein [Emcibacter nanhaiensis]|uniref:NAD(P)-dependent alcohol dehydrogenase n=1 Tax=Emcibacter nanhaiensis TaxID=1505037 RepID=A0A501PBZ2_9PROT|nr:NAD(P)-dependent alcohol dehydrogenase [Emcibacter nanhaiensis]TPD57893.1 NAD(P)-dependent alcohol dehydrogenase [Emcibacter nanhaiensis]
MKAYQIEAGSSSLDGLKQVELDKPEAGPGEVLVRVRATSLNYRDQAVVIGKYFIGPLQRDTIPLSDGAGEVEAVGDGVTRFKAGDRVAGTFFQGWVNGHPPASIPGIALGAPLDGMLAEYVVLSEEGLVGIPDNLSFEEAATLPCAGVTAWNALMEGRTLKPGDTVLCLGTGGVSMFALQFGRMAGARVIVTSSSDEKLERAKALGADGLINYRNTPNWAEEVMKLTGGQGVSQVVEVGGAGTLPLSYQAVGSGGEIALIGVLAAPDGDLSPHGLMFKAATLRGIFVGNRDMFDGMNKAIATNGIQPVIGATFDFDQAVEAFQHQMTASHFGKIVITV